LILKKIIIALLAACVLISTVYAENEIIVHLEGGGLEAPPDVTANAAVVINLQNEAVIYEKSASQKIYPGPVVKIMTAILAVEYINDASNNVDLDTKAVISRYVVNNAVGNNIEMK